jgi:hypothetical protein
MSDGLHHHDLTYPVPLRRRTDGERLDFVLREVALLVANVGTLQRKVEAQEERIKHLESRVD